MSCLFYIGLFLAGITASALAALPPKAKKVEPAPEQESRKEENHERY